MKRRMRLALWLYPRPWRDRYAREFEALLEDVGAAWREVWDVARKGLEMRLLRWNFASATMACAILGALIGGVWALRMPETYISTAVLRVPEKGEHLPDQLQAAQTKVLSRGSLAEIIMRENLYEAERHRLPMEDVIQEARNRNIRIRPLAAKDAQHVTAFSIDFQYPDRVKAQAVTRALTSRFVSTLPNVQVLDEPSLPLRPAQPNWLSSAVGGLLLGLAAGLTLLGIRRWPLVAVTGVATAAAAFGLSVVWPVNYVSAGVLATNGGSAPPIHQAITDDLLATLLHDDTLRLYTSERANTPVPDLIHRMRSQDLSIRPVGLPGGPGLAILFRSKDPVQARNVVLAILNSVAAGSAGAIRIHQPPLTPGREVAWNRDEGVVIGLGAGLLLGIVLTWMRRPRTLAAAA